VVPILQLTIAGRTIATTAEHPFYVRERGWTPAGELQPGNQLASLDGPWLAVDSLTDSGLLTTVYNFRVSNYHTYFVGTDQWGFAVWAHNRYDGDAAAVVRQQQEMAQSLMARGLSKSNAEYLARQIRINPDIDGTALLGRVNASEIPGNLNAAALQHQPNLRKAGMHGDIDFVPVGDGERMVIRIGSPQGGAQAPHLALHEGQMRASGEFLFITQDRSLARATGVTDLRNYPQPRFPGQETAGSLRPDIVGIRHDGGIHVVDVASPSQIVGTPRATFDNNIRIMQNGLAASPVTRGRNPIVDAVYPTYP